MILIAIGGIFTVVGAFCTYREIAEDEEHEPTRKWFREKWETVNSSDWNNMPEKVIQWSLELRKNSRKILDFRLTDSRICWMIFGIFLLSHRWVLGYEYIAFDAVFLYMLPLIICRLKGKSEEDYFDEMRELSLSTPGPIFFVGLYMLIGL